MVENTIFKLQFRPDMFRKPSEGYPPHCMLTVPHGEIGKSTFGRVLLVRIPNALKRKCLKLVLSGAKDLKVPKVHIPNTP